MLAIGNTKPLSIKNGMMKKKVVIMACCCVAETVDMKSPKPRVLKRHRQAAAKRSRRFPFRGMENHTMAKVITMTMRAWVIMI